MFTEAYGFIPGMMQQEDLRAMTAIPASTPSHTENPVRCFFPAAEPPDANLPEGWAVAMDPNGKPYYWHKATQKTQWEKPTA